MGGSESLASRIRAGSGYTPLQLEKLGGRPLCIEGATNVVSVHTGVLRAVVWTLEPRSETQAAACNVYGLTLHVADDQSLTEVDAHLLIQANIPLHAVCCHTIIIVYFLLLQSMQNATELCWMRIALRCGEYCLVFRWLSQLSWTRWSWRLTP